MPKAPALTIDMFLQFLDAHQMDLARLVAGDEGGVPLKAVAAQLAHIREDYAEAAKWVRETAAGMSDSVLVAKAQAVACALEGLELPPVPVQDYFKIGQAHWHETLKAPGARAGQVKEVGLADYRLLLQLLDPVLTGLDRYSPTGSEQDLFPAMPEGADNQQKFATWLRSCEPEAMRRPAGARWTTKENCAVQLVVMAFPRIKSLSEVVLKLRKTEEAVSDGSLFVLIPDGTHSATLHNQGFGVFNYADSTLQGWVLRKEYSGWPAGTPRRNDRRPFWYRHCFED